MVFFLFPLGAVRSGERKRFGGNVVSERVKEERRYVESGREGLIFCPLVGCHKRMRSYGVAPPPPPAAGSCAAAQKRLAADLTLPDLRCEAGDIAEADFDSTSSALLFLETGHVFLLEGGEGTSISGANFGLGSQRRARFEGKTRQGRTCRTTR